MRERLAEQKSKISIRDAIREIRGDIEKIFWMLRNTNTSASEGGGGSGGIAVQIVETLPPITDNGYNLVFWTSDGAGTGDDQLWEAYTGQTRWYPCQKPTTLSGAPGS